MTVADLLGGLVPESDLPDSGLPAVDVMSESIADIVRTLPAPFDRIDPDRIQRAIDSALSSVALIDRYAPTRFDGDLLFFTAARGTSSPDIGAASWKDAVSGVVDNHVVDATHWGMAAPAVLVQVARALADRGRQCNSGAGGPV